MNKKDKEILKKQFGNTVKTTRENKDLTVRDVEAKCSLDNSKISFIENGGANISLSTIVELARGMDVHPSELVKGDYDWLSPPH